MKTAKGALPETFEGVLHERALHLHAMLAGIGHAPEILSVKRPSEAGYAVDRGVDERDIWHILVRAVDGKSILDYLASRPSPESIHEVGEQIGSLLGFIHKHGFAHRDLNSQNILVAEERGKPRVYLFDNETASLAGEKWGFSRLDGLAKKVVGVVDMHVDKHDPHLDGLLRDTSHKFWRDRKKGLLVLAPQGYLNFMRHIGGSGKSLNKVISEAYEKEMTSPAMTFRGKPIEGLTRRAPHK